MLRKTRQRVPVLCDGAFTFDVELPVLVDEDGEGHVTLDTALEWERWQTFVAMTINDSSRSAATSEPSAGSAGTLAGVSHSDSSRATAAPRVLRLA